ncbi:MAG TPA: YdeI/OmpD-associated family protein [Longimicrobiaceae bacterium]|nr:YdeI/OmpD-associated family protein [Longimicrobiaceae bacterium]
MTKAQEALPVLLFENEAAWQAWLQEHHGSSAGLWLQLAKKGSSLRSLSYAEALEVALCYGWIDGQKRSHDASSWLQKFSPRGPRSLWSKRNVEKVQALVEAGRMHPAGLRAVEQAKADGRWEAAYDSQSTASIPADLQNALAGNPEANEFFSTLKGANRYAILFRIQTAKRPETRAKRIAQFIEMLQRHETIHP